MAVRDSWRNTVAKHRVTDESCRNSLRHELQTIASRRIMAWRDSWRSNSRHHSHLQLIHLCDTTHSHTHTIIFVTQGFAISFVTHIRDATIRDIIHVCDSFTCATRRICIYMLSHSWRNDSWHHSRMWLIRLCDTTHLHTHTITFVMQRFATLFTYVTHPSVRHDALKYTYYHIRHAMICDMVCDTHSWRNDSRHYSRMRLIHLCDTTHSHTHTITFVMQWCVTWFVTHIRDATIRDIIHVCDSFICATRRIRIHILSHSSRNDVRHSSWHTFVTQWFATLFTYAINLSVRHDAFAYTYYHIRGSMMCDMVRDTHSWRNDSRHYSRMRHICLSYTTHQPKYTITYLQVLIAAKNNDPSIFLPGYVYEYMCVYIHYIHIYIHICVFMYVCMQICVCICCCKGIDEFMVSRRYINMCVLACVLWIEQIHKHVYIYLHTHVFEHVSVFTCMYTHIYL